MRQRLMARVARSRRPGHRPAVEGLPIATRVHRLISVLWVLLLVVCVTAVGALQMQANEVERLTRAIGPAFDANAEVLQAMTDAETGLLGYQASHDPALLTPYQGARERTLGALSTLQDKLVLSTGSDDDPLDASLENHQRDDVQQWRTCAVRPTNAVPSGSMRYF